ncbi:hypothetical protein BD309DRAFT_989158 [Dichomitus squalens]|nr:hypothetical protein BD309DRAFT_989158 [Dichomitus squalens]
MAHATSPSHPGESSDSSPYPPRSEQLDVRRDIALLSYLLSSTKIEGRRSAVDAKAHSALDLWTYLAVIMNSPYDKAENKDIAVTGRIDRDTITAALVARSTSPHRLAPDTPPLQIKCVPYPRCHNYFAHSPAASSAKVYKHEGEQITRFFLFIAKRCCLKLHAHIANGRRMWSAHPTSYASARDRRRLSGYQNLYIVGPENGLRWAEMLVQCQDHMDKLFASLSQSSPEAQSLAYAAYISAAILDAVSQNGLFEILLTDGLAWHMQMKYVDAVGESRRPMLNSLFMSLGTIREGVVAEEIIKTATEDPAVADSDDNELIASENNKQRVIRYLRALAIPLAAAQFLVHYCHKLSPFSPGLEAFTVYATSSTITQGHIWEFKNGFLRHFRSATMALHTEAIIMALACSVHNRVREGAELRQQLSSITPVFEAPSIPIGVSKGCCFCCDLLAHLLMRSQKYTFHHSTISPWIPPDGVPFEVLREMRIQLLEIFYSAITDYVNSVPSLRTAQSVRDLSPLVLPSDMGLKST